ncbi:uncharacterized protein LOC122620368 [Drosophila teissieri]|uniref:uncharacterized protein LOC122620368 n=1 Tax=Drosophila teissieri TaxID=7243 RepID=UPI001CB9EC14|nr:uncharacterized protein LOC122620368 [Drosophila teissieri]
MLRNLRCHLIFILGFLFMAEKISCKFEFTNVQCTSLDKTFADFEFCYLRSVNRSYKYITLKVNLFKTPRYNGYRPFMFNITLDACRFLRNPDSNPVGKYFWEFFNSHSNLNHSCPYDHDLFVDKVSIDFVDHRVTKILPFPEGDYLLETHWMAYEIERATVKLYGRIS